MRGKDRTSWPAYVGTAVHHSLANAMSRRGDRYITEWKVEVGEINGVTIAGSVDLYDTETHTVIDWKTTGPSMLKTYKARIAKNEIPNQSYLVQANLYAAGVQFAGYRVDKLMLIFLPTSGDLSQAVVWKSEPNSEIVANAFTRANSLVTLLKEKKAQAFDALDMVDDFCLHCPFKGTGEIAHGLGKIPLCPGVSKKKQDDFTDIIGKEVTK
jgi:hypothetical protein